MMNQNYLNLDNKLTEVMMLMKDMDASRLRDNQNDYRLENSMNKINTDNLRDANMLNANKNAMYSFDSARLRDNQNAYRLENSILQLDHDDDDWDGWHHRGWRNRRRCWRGRCWGGYPYGPYGPYY